MRDLAGIIQAQHNVAVRRNALDIAETLCNCVAAHDGGLQENVVFDIARVLGKVAALLPDGNPDRAAGQRLHDLVFGGNLPTEPFKSDYVPVSTYVPHKAN